MACYLAETQDSVKKGQELYWLKAVSTTPLLLLFMNNSGMEPNFTVAEVSLKWVTHTHG